MLDYGPGILSRPYDCYLRCMQLIGDPVVDIYIKFIKSNLKSMDICCITLPHESVSTRVELPNRWSYHFSIYMPQPKSITTCETHADMDMIIRLIALAVRTL